MRPYNQRTLDKMFVATLIFNILAYSLSAFLVTFEAQSANISIAQAASVLESNPIVAQKYFSNNVIMIFASIVAPGLLTGIYFVLRNVLKERYHYILVFFVFMMLFITAKDSMNDIAVVAARMLAG